MYDRIKKWLDLFEAMQKKGVIGLAVAAVFGLLYWRSQSKWQDALADAEKRTRAALIACKTASVEETKKQAKQVKKDVEEVRKALEVATEPAP